MDLFLLNLNLMVTTRAESVWNGVGIMLQKYISSFHEAAWAWEIAVRHEPRASNFCSVSTGPSHMNYVPIHTSSSFIYLVHAPSFAAFLFNATSAIGFKGLPPFESQFSRQTLRHFVLYSSLKFVFTLVYITSRLPPTFT